MARLNKIAAAAAVLTGAITVGVPLMQFFLVFNMGIHHMHVLLVTGVSALVAAVLGLASACVTRSSVLPALHVVTAILLAALMGSFNTQVYLDLNMQCSISQSSIMGCSTCACAAASACTEALLKDCGGSCRALGTDLCARIGWKLLLLPFTGLIEAVLIAVPGFLSLLLLLQRSNSSVAVADYAPPAKGDVKVMVSAWPGQSQSEPEDPWPSTNPVAPSSKHQALQQDWPAAGQNAVADFGNTGSGLHQELSSGYMSSLGTNAVGPAAAEHAQEGSAAAKKKRAPGGTGSLKLKSSVAAARANAALG